MTKNNLHKFIDLYKSLYSGVIYDALRFDINLETPFVLSRNIKPISKIKTPMVGFAFTCQGTRVMDEKHIDDSIRIKMFKSFKTNSVQVISSGGYRGVAQFGDISARLAKKFGAKGAVIDGPTRDAAIIQELDFKLFSDGIQPIDAYSKWQITKFEVPIHMRGEEGDVLVNPGDMIWGDNDGVLVVPSELIAETYNLAIKRLNRENLIREQIKNYEDIQDMYDDLGRW